MTRRTRAAAGLVVIFLGQAQTQLRGGSVLLQ